MLAAASWSVLARGVAIAAGSVAVAIVIVRWRRHARGERVLLVGASPLTIQLAQEIASRPRARWRIAGLVADLRAGVVPPVGPWLGRLSSLAGVIRVTRPTLIVVAPADRRRAEVHEPLVDARLRGLTVEDPIRALERLTGKLPIELLSSRSLVLSAGFRHSDLAPSDSTLVVTRLVSTIVAAVALLVLAPAFAVIALAIVVDSRGPIFFVQERVGMGGRPFRLIKFRTMHEEAGHQSEWVCDNAARITRVGRVLRRFRLDEWPQFVNVLRGEMALVGPRPQPVSNCALFLARIPHYRLRSAVRPGITGWAQVRYGYANNLEEETEKMRYDLYYIKHRSLWLDLRILAETAGVLLFDRRSHQAVKAESPAADWLAPMVDTPTGARAS